MDDVFGGERAIPVVELHTLPQREGPFLEIGARLPLLGQAWRVLAGLRIHVEQRFEERVVLEMVGSGDHPESVAVLEPGGGEHQLLDLRVLCRSGCRRGPQRERQRHEQ